MFQRFRAWCSRTATAAGLALLVLFFIFILTTLSEAANRPPRPTYQRDDKTGLCFATFERKDGREHLLVPCTPDVLRQIR